jgi:hypothetical protein
VDPRPRDDTDADQDIARELADVAATLAYLKGEANAYLTDPNYSDLQLRLEITHSAAEAATVEGLLATLALLRLLFVLPNWHQHSSANWILPGATRCLRIGGVARRGCRRLRTVRAARGL